MRARRAALSCVLAAATAAGCGGGGPLSRWTPERTPHERYAESLRSAGLEAYALGTAWLSAADTALTDPEPVTMPLRETGYLDPASPSAIAYRFELPRGRVLDVDVVFEPTGAAADGGTPPQLFLDLFLVTERGVNRLASADKGATTLRHVSRRDGAYVLRLQPELLAGGRYTITQRTEASLRFPVEGAGASAVHSVFGDARDGGSRDHHGIDIFAPRGTPVVAAADGVVRRIETTSRGGRVIWLSDTTHGQSLYYAHLHEWATEAGRRVSAGDVIGYVGNTGNASTTPPHLHFGIYSGGPVDPLPFVKPDDRRPSEPSGDAGLLGEWARVGRRRAGLRESTASAATTLASLEPGTAVRVTAARAGVFRVVLPDGRAGYVAASAIARLSTPLRTRTLREGDALLSAPTARGVVVDVAREPARAGVLAEFSGFALVDAGGRRGWVRDGT